MSGGEIWGISLQIEGGELTQTWGGRIAGELFSAEGVAPFDITPRPGLRHRK